MTHETRRRALLSTAKVALSVSLFTGCQSGVIELESTDDMNGTALLRGTQPAGDDTGLDLPDTGTLELTDEEQCQQELADVDDTAMIEDWDRLWECCELLGYPWEIGFCTPWGPPTPVAMPEAMVA